MTRALVLAALVMAHAGCLGAQPARVLAPGRTSVTAGAARVASAAIPGDEEEAPRWSGELAVRRGVARRVDAAVMLARTAGRSGAVYLAAVEPRVQVVPPRGRVAIAAGLAAGVAGAEYIVVADVDTRRETRFMGYLLAPSATIGLDVRPGVELVLVPRAYVLVPARSSEPNRLGLGGLAGLRLGDASRTWAVQPELGVTRIDGDTLVTLGLSISAGD